MTKIFTYHLPLLCLLTTLCPTSKAFLPSYNAASFHNKIGIRKHTSRVGQFLSSSHRQQLDKSLTMVASNIHNKLLNLPSLRHKYYALRHGQSKANVEGIISSDPAISIATHGLSEVGREQVLTSANAFVQRFLQEGCHERFAGVAIYTSDFMRARETANIFYFTLSQAKVPTLVCSTPTAENGPQVDTRLRERYFGLYNGKSDSHYQDVWDIDANDPNHTDMSVESVNKVMARTTDLILDLEKKLSLESSKSGTGKPYKCILVAHGDVLQILQTAFQKKDGNFHRSLQHLETASVRELVLFDS